MLFTSFPQVFIHFVCYLRHSRGWRGEWVAGNGAGWGGACVGTCSGLLSSFIASVFKTYDKKGFMFNNALSQGIKRAVEVSCIQVCRIKEDLVSDQHGELLQRACKKRDPKIAVRRFFTNLSCHGVCCW